MAVSAHDVAREMRALLPGVGDKKLHKLLYLSQGHHLAWYDQPLFIDAIHAYDMGPVVDRIWRDEKAGRDVSPVALDEAAINTLLYVVSRYGGLTGRDLEILSHWQTPWMTADRARRAGGSDVLLPHVMKEYFTRADQDEETPWPTDDTVAAALRGASERRSQAAVVDDVDRLRSRARAR
jgi:uncharacterized phage-associated protein